MTTRMPTPPEARKVIVGVDTHKHVHVAVAIDSWGIRLRDQAFVADSGGYQALITWAETHGRIEAFGVEGAGSYGAGLARAVRRAGHRVVEVNRGDRRTRRAAGKSDTIDAEVAARSPACRARSGSGSLARRPSSRRTRASPQCAGTHRRANCAASPARTSRAASRGAAAPAPRRRPPRPWARAGRGAARSADPCPPGPACGGRTPRRAPRPATPTGSRRARASGAGPGSHQPSAPERHDHEPSSLIRTGSTLGGGSAGRFSDNSCGHFSSFRPVTSHRRLAC